MGHPLYRTAMRFVGGYAMQADIRTYFEAEAKELIDRLTGGAAALGAGAGFGGSGKNEADAVAVADMLRAAHTLKGAAHVVGERRLAQLAHEFEDGLAEYRKEASPGLAERLLGLVDGLAAELAGTSGGPESISDAEPAPVVTAAASSIAGPQPGAIARAQPGAAKPGAEEETSGPAGSEMGVARRRSQTVRVEVVEAQRLLDGLGESGLRVASVAAALARLEELEGTGTAEMRRAQRASLRRDMGEELGRLERDLAAMHGVASQLRLGTAEALLLDAGRVARATAAAQGKAVRCATSGAGERVELPILDAMGDALLHLVRNAVAHGMETPEERRAAGKPAEGTIRVEVSRQGNDAVFTCADDGRGIALEPVREVAVARGEMSAAEAGAATEEELLALLLRPGFSLSRGVDEVSGRGVGLDAVSEAVARVRGRIVISSSTASGAGQGTTFRIVAPQSMFAVRAMEVEVGGRRVEVPLAGVEQTFRLDPHLNQPVGRTQTLLVGRETMSFAWLNDAFPGGSGGRAGRSLEGVSATCLVLEDRGRRMALGVDRVCGLGDVLVQPLPRFAGIASLVAGTSLGTDGVPRPVVDVGELMTFLGGRAGGTSVEQETREAVALPILVIDDSLTTRMLEQSILEAEGYEVELATSAEQGLAMARKKAYALFLVDVEMPGMNGFEFVATVNADARLRATPCILVTSLDSAESRERGRAAGAYSYIVKGEFNQAVYLDRIRGVVGGAV